MSDKGKKKKIISYFENGELEMNFVLNDDEIISGVRYDESGNVVEEYKEKEKSTVEMVESLFKNYK